MSKLLNTLHVWTEFSSNPAYYELAWAELNGRYHLRSQAWLGNQRIGYLLYKDVSFDPQVGISSIPSVLFSRIQGEIREAANDGLRRIEREKRMN